MKKKISFNKLHIKESIQVDCGDILKDYEIAFETFGKLNKKKRMQS